MSTDNEPGPRVYVMKAGASEVAALEGDDLLKSLKKRGNLSGLELEMVAALELTRAYLRSPHFDAGGRDAVAFVVETAIVNAASKVKT